MVTDAAERADRIAQLMEKKLRVRGRGLERKLRKAGRLVPGWVRKDAQALVQAQQLSASPKLMKMIDPARVDRAYRRCAESNVPITGKVRTLSHT